MKVFGINIDGVNRCIVAAKSMKRAAELFGVSYSYARGWGSETWNEDEVRIATATPEQVYIAPDRHGAVYQIRP
jgi:hypothetical protein